MSPPVGCYRLRTVVIPILVVPTIGGISSIRVAHQRNSRVRLCLGGLFGGGGLGINAGGTWD